MRAILWIWMQTDFVHERCLWHSCAWSCWRIWLILRDVQVRRSLSSTWKRVQLPLCGSEWMSSVLICSLCVGRWIIMFLHKMKTDESRCLRSESKGEISEQRAGKVSCLIVLAALLTREKLPRLLFSSIRAWDTHKIKITQEHKKASNPQEGALGWSLLSVVKTVLWHWRASPWNGLSPVHCGLES